MKQRLTFEKLHGDYKKKKCRWIKHHSLCCHLICSVFTLKMEFCLPSRKGGEGQVVPGGEDAHTV